MLKLEQKQITIRHIATKNTVCVGMLMEVYLFSVFYVLSNGFGDVIGFGKLLFYQLLCGFWEYVDRHFENAFIRQKFIRCM